MARNFKAILISFGGGIFMGLAPAPFNAWFLAWVALVPLWIVIRKTPKFNRQVILSCLAWGCGYHGLTLFWITGVHPMTWMGVPWLSSLAIALFCWLFITCWGAILVIFWGIIVNRVRFKGKNNFILNSLLIVLIATTCWSLLETLWTNSPLWWTDLTLTQSPSNLIILQLGKISGVNTTSIAIVAVNGLLAEVILSWNKISQKLTDKLFIFSPITLFLLVHSLGYWLYIQPIATDNLNPIKVGIIQGNIPNEIKLYSQGWRQAIAGYTAGYQRLVKQDVDVVLTPEGALPFYWQNILDDSTIYRAVTQEQIPIWLGAYGQTNHGYTNSLFTLTGAGETFSRYDKHKLVPLGEYIPFESVLGGIIDRLSPLEARQIPGKSNQIFNTPFGRAIVGICYESAFAPYFRRQTKAGGEFIITASNNAHYSHTMPAQHHAQDVIRAIESDRWAARATNTGYSAIVDPHGATLWISPLNRYVIHADTIYRRQTQTLYVRWGDWLTPLLVIFSGIGFLLSSKQ
ncbi:MAG: apolipoprotein N-acyltransferase [Pleurocapsa sp.]